MVPKRLKEHPIVGMLTCSLVVLLIAVDRKLKEITVQDESDLDLH